MRVYGKFLTPIAVESTSFGCFLTSYADFLRGSPRVPAPVSGAGTHDEPLRTSAWETRCFPECLEGEWGLPEVDNIGKADLGSQRLTVSRKTNAINPAQTSSRCPATLVALFS